ncbi:K+-transporting ATPase, KdpF subunit [Streptomyces sp. DvalAA-14]|nr:potassium-transporting ATPase subunit F [Streptomyces sp. DvalAA-14]MYS25087.1 potassium-transporting ATPase subunit F [Streptomyces sp. SID4948]SCE52045.1 K+-transporting ATPase, KdpF subunit [Streptomyces sp. DvalAA-14]
MSADNLAGLVVAGIVLVYLVLALIYPEKF